MNNNPIILFFMPQLGGGGAEINAIRIANHLPAHGFKPVFAICRSGGKYEKFVSRTVDIRVLDTGNINSCTLRLARSIRPLRRFIKETNPSLLCPIMDHVCLAALAARRGIVEKPPIVLNIQNSLKGKLINNKGLRQKLQLELIKRMFPSADSAIALSKGVANDLCSIVPSLENRTKIIPNAIDIDLVEPNNNSKTNHLQLKGPEQGSLIVACGRLVEQKGFTYLLQAFANLPNSYKAHLWILGEGPLENQLKRQATVLQCFERVKFLGFQPNPRAYMQMADVFVLSSLWEGFGNVIVEAMSTGVPVVATNCPHGPSEIIESGVNGLLVPPANQDALKNAIGEILNNKKLRERLSQEGQKRSKDFLANRIAMQYAEEFRTIITKNQ